MTELGLVIDPGVSNGLCFFTFGDDEPFRVENLWQFRGGAVYLGRALDRLRIRVDPGTQLTRPAVPPHVAFGERTLDHLIVEKFTPRQNEGFNLTQEDVEPLRGEGVLLGRGFESFIIWREPGMQYFMSPPDTPLPQKKKDARAFLETHNLLPTGSDVGQKDADDAISATLHAIAWLRKRRHMPTLRALFPRKDTPQ